ncbi:hypothetical protein N7491_007866 [Penicillium cf. griseofulvum]|uniref:Carrier domain-containing protein n=1 Tax=Penicillium cf. griseofulvum TaxID=2972120 RepID=A0A9W9M553_9EURO|nr:hypothetical protein N7472_009105 [Penicillium cf. griseofulvum]KAJ5427424.1 hypothetical protein N7491_007866 [Penicillium cf. griseofulvum]
MELALSDVSQRPVLDLIASVLNVHSSNVDTTRTFTCLGGHSLLAIQLATMCNEAEIDLSVETIMSSKSIDDLIENARCSSLSSSTPTTSPSEIASDAQERFLTRLGGRIGEHNDTVLPGPPLTEMQLALIHGTQRHPSRNIISYFETYSSEYLPVLRQAWQTVVSMEPIFRIKIDLRDGTHMVEQAEAPFIWTEKTVQSQLAYEKALNNTPPLDQGAAEEDCGMMLGARYDVVTLDKDPDRKVSTVVWRMHHALIDGYSATLVLEKVHRVAAGLKIKPSPSFINLAQRLECLQVTSREAAQEFWRNQYSQYDLASDRLQFPAPQIPVEGTRAISFKMPKEVATLAQLTGVTTATVTYAAWAMALGLFADSETVVFGAVLSGRNLPLADVTTTIGPLVNTLPLHIKLDRNQTVEQFLQDVFRQLVTLSSFQWTLPEHGYSRKFDSAVSMQLAIPDTLKASDIRPLEPPYSCSETDFPLSIFVEADGTVRLQYDRSIYHDDAIKLLSQHYERAFALLLDRTANLRQVREDLLTAEAREALLALGNCHSPRTSFGHIPNDLVTLFREAASQHGDHIAVQRGDKFLPYAEMLEWSTRVAHQLAAVITAGDVVCLHADQSVEWVVGIYGILLAGGVYCAVEAKLPQNVRNSYAATAGAAVFLVPSQGQSHFKPTTCAVVLSVEECIDNVIGADIIPSIIPLANPEGNAYVCFTSGSTGQPKGVICTHAGLVAFQRDLTVRLMAQPGWKVAQTMSPAFDGSIHEIFSSLSYGATLILPHSSDPFAHLNDVDSCILTPSVAKVLDPDRFSNLQAVYLVGEPVSQEVNDRWSQTKSLFNMYGPTEGTGGATIKKLLPGKPVTIGQPNPSTRIYVLSHRQLLMPPGAIGEIWLAGVQVARGYIGLPEQTADRFRQDSICPETGEKMYRTGDYGYWDGTSRELVCLGRKDRQIKLRGFRLDLNDLEIRLLKLHSSVTAVAISRKDDYLNAMVTPASVDTSLLADRARQALPIHAIPRYFVAVDRLPMTPAGKLDYKAVANAIPTVSSTPSPAQPSLSTTEKRVARLWHLVLGLEPSQAITRLSRFFDLGGHSVQQLHLASRLNEEFQCRIPFRIAVECSTVQEMADRIEHLLAKEAMSPRDIQGPMRRVDEHDLAPIELEWWQKYQLSEGTSAFNVCFVGHFDPTRLDSRRLTTSWNSVLGQHPILRSRYLPDRRTGVRRRFANGPPQVHRLDHIDLWKEVNRPFMLTHQDPIRVMVSRNTLLVVVSHIICDLNTLMLLHDQVIRLYRGEMTVPPTPKLGYMQVMMENSICASCDLDFWLEYMAQAPDPVRDSFAVATDRLSYRGSSLLYPIPRSAMARLLQLGQESRLSLHQLALAAVALTMRAAETRPIDIVLGGPHLNRKTQEARETIGLFLEPLPIRIRERTPAPEHTQDFLQTVRHSSQEALGHAVPWNQLLRHLGVVPDYPNHPLFDIMVTFHDNRKKHLFALPGFECDPIGIWTQGAKFKLLFEFSMGSDDHLRMRVEHDIDCYPDVVVQKIVRVLLLALDLLGTEPSYPVLRRQLAKEVGA